MCKRYKMFDETTDHIFWEKKLQFKSLSIVYNILLVETHKVHVYS